jgi:hypothetical protein
MKSDQSKPAQLPSQREISRDFSKEESAQGAAALLEELASSLEASQKAVLSGDLRSLQQETREQARLHRALQILWNSGRPIATVPQLRARQQRVLDLGRVLQALLARRQRWLRTLAHLAAGPGAIYGPPSPAAGNARQETPCQA